MVHGVAIVLRSMRNANQVKFIDSHPDCLVFLDAGTLTSERPILTQSGFLLPCEKM